MLETSEHILSPFKTIALISAAPPHTQFQLMGNNLALLTVVVPLTSLRSRLRKKRIECPASTPETSVEKHG